MAHLFFVLFACVGISLINLRKKKLKYLAKTVMLVNELLQ